MLPSKCVTPFLGIWASSFAPSSVLLVSGKAIINEEKVPRAFARSPTVSHYSKELLLPTTPCHCHRPRHLLPRPPPRDFGLPYSGLLLPVLPLNPDALRRRLHLWPRPHSVPSLALAPTAPMAYARTPLCHRGPLWVGLADLPPTLDASHRSGTAWSLPSEPGLALSPSKIRRPASPSPARRRT